jgi:uncharacterized YccA/Bax inhibitor family protein
MRKSALRIVVHHSDPSHFLWYLAIVMMTCVGWLFYTILRALR